MDAILKNRESLKQLKVIAKVANVSEQTLRRWCKEGYRGVRLEHVRKGRSIETSEEAYWRFVHELTAGSHRGN